MFKRLSAIFIAFIMCLSLMTPAFAAVTADTKASIIVKNVDSTGTDSDVVAYKIIEPSFDGVDENGDPTGTGNFLGWKWTSGAKTALGLTTDDYITQITAEQFNKLVAAIRADSEEGGEETKTPAFTSLSLQGVKTASGTLAVGDYTTNVATAGSYIILITPKDSASKIYNPLIASVNIEAEPDEDGTVDNILVNGSVNANGEFVVDQTTGVIQDLEKAGAGQTAVYAKSSTINIQKTTDDGNGNQVTNGSLGDTVPYVVTTTVPTYSVNDYTKVEFTISDKLSPGLDYVIPKNETLPTITVQYSKDNGTTYADVHNENNSAYTVTYNAGSKSFDLAFTSPWILNNPAVKLKISYSATINSSAVTGFDPNTNTVTLTYTNDPSGKTNSDEDEYREYTFSINGSITGDTTIEGTKTQVNFVKTGDEVRTSNTEIKTVNEPIAGAKFALYVDDNGKPSGDPIREGTSNNLGLFTMNQLGEGTYWLVETTAPKGYALNSIPVKVVIEASIENDTLIDYTVTIGEGNNQHSTKYEIKLNGNTEKYEIVTTFGSENDPGFYEFINTTISTLPSTGSYGTYAFILVGCIIMATALTMFIVKRKESK